MEERMKVLIAYDGSDSSDGAIADLRRAGLPETAEALVVTMADVFLPFEEEVAGKNRSPELSAVKRARERARNEVEAARALAKRATEQISAAFPRWDVNYRALADSPAWAIIRTADEWKPDLIVMGARGHSVFGGRLILGSISQRVLYEARCSVRIARGVAGDEESSVRILIGVDHSVDSNAAVEVVCSRAWPKGSEVALLTVVDTVMEVDDVNEPGHKRWIEVGEEKSWDQVREIFAPAAERLRAAGLHTEILVRRGNPTDQLLEEADTWGADCIFVGAKGTRGIDRLLLGSMSSAVSARAHCSVEVVRPL